jgi:hypothetical protein
MNQPEQPKYCEHANCRLDTAVELSFMGTTLYRPDLLTLAGQVHSSTVRCRLLPRKGPIHAPFPLRSK